MVAIGSSQKINVNMGIFRQGGQFFAFLGKKKDKKLKVGALEWNIKLKGKRHQENSPAPSPGPKHQQQTEVQEHLLLAHRLSNACLEL